MHNHDLAERIDALGVWAEYDDDEDALYVRFGQATEALTESAGQGLYLRVVPETLKIVGLEVSGVSTLLAGGLRLVLHALEAGQAYWCARAPETAPPQKVTSEVGRARHHPARLAADIRSLVTAA